tara:strand:- start:2089 stop:2469 length:381 start_codon:yes stop_codon:yes gene_type:complete
MKKVKKMIDRKYEEYQLLRISAAGLFCVLFVMMIGDGNSISKSLGFSLVTTTFFYLFAQAIRGREPVIRDDRIQFPDVWELYSNSALMPSGYKEIQAAIESGRNIESVVEDLNDDGQINESNLEEE